MKNVSSSSARAGLFVLTLFVLAAAAVWLIGGPLSAQDKTKVNPQDGLTYVFVPPGMFQMGCSAGDANCSDEEKPAHSVTITKGFWLGQTPVTREAFKKIVSANSKDYDIDVGGDFAKDGKQPVEGASWWDALAYCQAVKMRIPTEAEWEYAARGGTTGSTYAPLDQIAWYSTNSGGTTHEVGKKQPNRYGLYDMLGNVWQWTADWYGPYKNESAVDPKGTANGQERVLRGGSWEYDDSFVRVSFRFWENPAGIPILRQKPTPPFGFRCAGD